MGTTEHLAAEDPYSEATALELWAAGELHDETGAGSAALAVGAMTGAAGGPGRVLRAVRAGSLRESRSGTGAARAGSETEAGGPGWAWSPSRPVCVRRGAA